MFDNVHLVRAELALRLSQANRDRDHTLLYLRFRPVSARQNEELRRALERVTSKLWGLLVLSDLGDAAYTLLLEGWSVSRSEQLVELLELALRRGCCRSGMQVRMEAGAIPVRGELDAGGLLSQATAALRGERNPPR